MKDQSVLFQFAEPDFTEAITKATVSQINYQTAANLIEQHHYLGAAGSTVYAFGLYFEGVLAGVMTYGTIPGPNARGICGGEHQNKVLELTRLFVHDWMGKNAESYFIGRTFALLTPRAVRQGVVGQFEK